jgi:ABC-type phosphate transport system substrate-binding protein
MLMLLRAAVICTVIFLSINARAEIVVIVHNDNPTVTLSTRELVDLYMGRNLYFPNGSLALRLDQAPTSTIRAHFYQSLVKKSVAQVNAYWAKLLFTGRASPPMPLQNSNDILETIRNNKNAVGYIDAAEFDNSVKVIARVN